MLTYIYYTVEGSYHHFITLISFELQCETYLLTVCPFAFVLSFRLTLFTMRRLATARDNPSWLLCCCCTWVHTSAGFRKNPVQINPLSRAQRDCFVFIWHWFLFFLDILHCWRLIMMSVVYSAVVECDQVHLCKYCNWGTWVFSSHATFYFYYIIYQRELLCFLLHYIYFTALVT